MAEPASDTVMPIEVLSKYPKTSRPTLYKPAHEGKLPAQKVGRHWRFHRAAVDRWLGDDTSKTLRNDSEREDA
jgi:excisionase family DNA binding protein